MPLLAHDVVHPEGDLTFVFVHGILGSRNNWRGFVRRLIERLPRARCVLVDLRNHGDSHGQPPPHTIRASADDVANLVSHLGLQPDVLVGHSYGGKVMLELALGHTVAARVAWSLDSPPGVRTFGEAREQLDAVLDGVAGISLPVADRKALVSSLLERGLPDPIAQWMTTNLRPADDGAGFVWRFDLGAIPQMLASFGVCDLWPALEAHQGSPEVHIVRGGRSDRWSDDERARLLRAVARGVVVEHVLPTAGHWVHTDDAEGLLALLVDSARSMT